jgi:lysyl-tRNA synthetase class 2
MYRFDPEWLEKLDTLRDMGIAPYPNGFTVTHTSTELHAQYKDSETPETDGGSEPISIGGRLLFRNRMGKAMFLRIQDRGEATVHTTDKDGEPTVKGGVIQVWVKRDNVGEEVFNGLTKLDIGDIVWAKGTMMRTRTGELTLSATEAALAGKTLNPFPDRQHGVADVQTRARQRYVDLFMNEATRDTFRKRSRIVRFIRDYFEDQDFLEVETPMLQVIPGGAAARPFTTHHNALDIPLYLRIAPELYLKRLVVGGFDRVFEINRSYRNEGVSIKHNPEFTMLEYYQAWATDADLMDHTETLFASLAERICGSTDVVFQDRTLSFAAPFRRADMDALIAEHTDLTLETLQDADAIRSWWVANNGDGDGLPTTTGRWWEKLFDVYVEDKLINPTFVTGFPAEISPLSRRRDDDPERVDRFELIVNGWEIANGFSELNDPVDQAARFEAQVAARDAGDDESMFFDADYVRALSYGMPPTAGEGIGIDRLVMLLTNSTSIREVILFPTMRPERPADAEADA